MSKRIIGVILFLAIVVLIAQRINKEKKIQIPDKTAEKQIQQEKESSQSLADLPKEDREWIKSASEKDSVEKSTESVSLVEAFDSDDPIGKGIKLKPKIEGKVTRINYEDKRIRIVEKNELVTYMLIRSATEIYRDGKKIAFKDLKDGDEVVIEE